MNGWVVVALIFLASGVLQVIGMLFVPTLIEKRFRTQVLNDLYHGAALATAIAVILLIIGAAVGGVL